MRKAGDASGASIVRRPRVRSAPLSATVIPKAAVTLPGPLASLRAWGGTPRRRAIARASPGDIRADRARPPPRDGDRTIETASAPDPLLDRGDDLLDAVTQGVLGQGAPARVVTDGARFVGVSEVVIELPSQIGEIAI